MAKGLFEIGMEAETLTNGSLYPWNASLNAYDLLHGNCTVFASVLNREFGYPVYAAFDYDKNMVHSFCFNEYDEFVDVRGTTSDYVEFLEEFEDEIDVQDTDIDILNFNPDDFMQDNNPAYQIALDMVERYRGWYC